MSFVNGCRTNTSIECGFIFAFISKLSVFFFLVLNICYLHSTLDNDRKVYAYNVVRVCQNKHCCKRANADILQTIHNLIDVGSGDSDVIVEASGCLSQCDKGPNVEVTTRSGSMLMHGMTDTQNCALQLGEASLTTPSFPPVPKILVAASKVIERSHQFSASGQLEEEIRFLTSVINKLEDSPALPPSTSANADAHALRAHSRLQLVSKEKERAASDGKEESHRHDAILNAISDAKRVVQDLSVAATPASLSLAYRTWTDAELFLAEERGQQKKQNEKEISKKRDFSRVVDVLTEWHSAQPMYRTKLQGEIQSLMLGMG